ncbi:Dps family protein [Fusibacter sp. JL298sf-3]
MKHLQAMNTYLSNLSVLNAKLHNLHWNVVGINFVAIHNFTESLYDEVFESFDAVAEHLKMSGEMPLSRIADYLEHATLKEIEPKAFSAKEVLDILIDDLGEMRKLALDIRQVADESGDPIAVAMFEDHIASYNKHIWFLSAMRQG